MHNMYNTDKALGIIKRFEAAKNKKAQFLTIWQEVADYVLPNRGGFYDIDSSTYSVTTFDTHPAKYDDTATNALMKASSAFFSYTANPATQWFGFSLISSTNKSEKQYTVNALLKRRDVREFLDQTAQTVARYINVNAQEGWNALSQEVIAFSTSALYIMEDPSENVLNIQPVALKNLYVLNSIGGGIGEVYRTLLMTNEQVFMEFAGKGCLPPGLDDLAVQDPLKERVILHAVFPRAIRDITMPDARNMPWASVWVDLQTKTVMYESGFEEMPYAVARINVPADYVYGFSPAMNVRHTVKSLNKLVKQKLSAGDMALNPPMNVPLDTYVNPLSLKPAALNYHEPDSQFRAEPMHTVGNFQINTETIQDAREQVRQGLLIDLIEQTNKDNTYQAMQEQLLQLKLMSPWQGSIEKTCLKPLVMRVYAILHRRGGILPDMPPVLQQALENKSVKIQIVYESPLAKAQQHPKLQAIERTIAFAGQMAQMGGMNAVNMDETVRLYAELLGTPPGVLYSPDELEQRNAAAQQQQQAMQEAALAQQQAATAQDQAGAIRDAAQAQATMSEASPQAQAGGMSGLQALLGGM